MKWDWTVRGTITTTDSCIERKSAYWTDLTNEEAEARIDALIKREKRRRGFFGIMLQAIGNKPNVRGFAVINKAEMKDTK